MKLHDVLIEAQELGFRYIAIDLTGDIYAYRIPPRVIIVVDEHLIDGIVYIVNLNLSNIIDGQMFLGRFDFLIPKTPTILDIKKITLRNVL